MEVNLKEWLILVGLWVKPVLIRGGGGDTTYIKILTDVKGNLITVYPIKGGTQ